MGMKNLWGRVRYDLQYVFLNQFVCNIPSWTIRKYLYQLCGMQFGKDSRIGIGTVVISPQNIRIGPGTVINENCVLDGRGGLSIGHDTSISMNCKILTASHDADSPGFAFRTRRTKIGNNVWTGTSAIVLDGTRIGDFAVVGAGAVVKNSVREKTIVIGNPAREIRIRKISRPYCLSYKAYFR